MSVPSVGGSPVISQLASDHTLQAFIELVYIRTANEVLVEQMQSLESSLGVTKSAMDTLTQLQNLHNLVSVKSKGDFNDVAAYGTQTNPQFYKDSIAAFFGTPVIVSVSFFSLQTASTGGGSVFLTRMMTIKSQLSSQIANLSGITPTISGREDSNSLLSKLRVVLKDITDNSATTTISGATKWLVDNYNTNAIYGGPLSTAINTKSGLIQQNITNAITAGQSLNTTQTESVRNFLYLFEEYYKSASAVLQQISQIIQKMAGGIAR